MTLRIAALVLLLTSLVGGAAYLLGAFLQAPEDVRALFERPTPHSQHAPLPVSPADKSEFVQSDISLKWNWPGGLAENQIYALRIGADDLPYQEFWTVDSKISIQQAIDSFSIDFGRFYWQIAVLNLDSDGRYESMGSEWSDKTELLRLRRPSLPAKPYEGMSAAARLFADQDLGASNLIDAVHLFIHENSETDEQLPYSPDYSDAVDLMYEHSQGNTTDMPQLMCDGRSTAMLTLLEELGIESRLVFLYKDVPGWIAQHTVLEVFNPDNQYWQLHDLASDLYYFDIESGIRPNAASILFDNETEFAGCPIDGGSCSAALVEAELTYFKALRYGHHSFEIWVNPDRIDLSARYAGHENQNLAEFISGGNPRQLTIRLDSWQEPR